MFDREKEYLPRLPSYAVYMQINIFGKYITRHQFTFTIGQVFALEFSEDLLKKIYASEQRNNFRTLVNVIQGEIDLQSTLSCSVVFCNENVELTNTLPLIIEVAKYIWNKRGQIRSWS